MKNSSNTAGKRKIAKILYIAYGIEEKASALILETYAGRIETHAICITVVPNIFIGLECLEHTIYAGIIVASDLQFMSAEDLKTVFTSLGLKIPITLLMDKSDAQEHPGLVSTLRTQYHDVLLQPYGADELCRVIRSMIRYDEEVLNPPPRRPAAVLKQHSYPPQQPRTQLFDTHPHSQQSRHGHEPLHGIDPDFRFPVQPQRQQATLQQMAQNIDFELNPPTSHHQQASAQHDHTKRVNNKRTEEYAASVSQDARLQEYLNNFQSKEKYVSIAQQIASDSSNSNSGSIGTHQSSQFYSTATAFSQHQQNQQNQHNQQQVYRENAAFSVVSSSSSSSTTHYGSSGNLSGSSSTGPHQQRSLADTAFHNAMGTINVDGHGHDHGHSVAAVPLFADSTHSQQQYPLRDSSNVNGGNNSAGGVAAADSVPVYAYLPTTNTAAVSSPSVSHQPVSHTRGSASLQLQQPPPRPQQTQALLWPQHHHHQPQTQQQAEIPVMEEEDTLSSLNLFNTDDGLSDDELDF